MGSMQESPQRTVWYLTEGEQLHVIAAGETIGAWRVDGLRGGQLELTYVPLQQRRALAIEVLP